MKKLLLLCTAVLLSCSADDESVTQEEVNLLIDHYKTTSLFYGTALVAYENGSSISIEIPAIAGFEFEQRNTYDIITSKKTTKNSGTNATTVGYELLSVVAQDSVPASTRFAMPLAKFVNGLGYVKFVVGNAETGYIISNEITMDCTYFCSELYSRLSIEDNITGEFEHGPEGTYVLMALY